MAVIKMSNKTFQYYLSKFLQEEMITNKNLSKNTVASYADTYKLFLIYMQEKKSVSANYVTLENLNRNTVYEFLNWLESDRKVSITTRNIRLAAIHSFVKYLQIEDPAHIYEYQKILSIKKKKFCSKEVMWLTKNQIKILLSVIDDKKFMGLRDKTLLTLLYDAALRVDELICLKYNDVHFSNQTIIKVLGKGSKSRTIPLMGHTAELLKKYIKEFDIQTKKNKGYETLFFNRSGDNLTRAGIAYIINKYVDLANKNNANITINVHPHVFRHSKAVHLLEAGIELIYIRDFLGHSSVKTTEIYAKVCNESKLQALQNVYENIIDKNDKDWTQNDDLMCFLTRLSKKQ